ncbi:MAG: hypothetical protein LC631_03165, partial [Desulfovibrionales bacterium]|nr:hypothetical protein [Desulfovibrionales bacterium]
LSILHKQISALLKNVNMEAIMYLKRVLIGLLPLIIFTTGCATRIYEPVISQPVASQVPVPAAYPLSTQQKMQAIHHWEVLANDVACRISDSLEANVFDTYYPVYVAAGGSTPFEKSFYDLLITKLVENGIRVTRSKNEAMVLSFDLNMVRHGRRNISTQGGVYRSLAPGMFVKRQPPGNTTLDAIHSAEMHVAQSQINVDSGKYTNFVPNVEIMITTSLTRNQNYIVRDSSIYYINDSDWGNYKQNVMYQDPSVVNYRIVDQ